MIHVRFARDAAHKFLGLTGEVLRPEKVTNGTACDPPPTSFYQGGLQSIRASASPAPFRCRK